MDSLSERITVAAHRLTVFFTENADLPARYKNLSDPDRKLRKVNEDSDVEKRFNASVDSWNQVIETMLGKLDESQAWRFIDLRPQIDGTIRGITENSDFCDFISYMILRRDKEHCDNDELGDLAQLSVAIQREVEKHIQT